VKHKGKFKSDALRRVYNHVQSKDLLFFFMNHYVTIPRHQEAYRNVSRALSESYATVSVKYALTTAIIAFAMGHVACFTRRIEHEYRSISK